MKRKATTILLFVCLVGPIAGTYFWLQLKKAGVRREVKQQLIKGIAKEELTKIKISSQEAHLLSWKDDHEFEYQNKMFDVVKTEMNGDTTTYLCWQDQKESNINHQLSMLLARRMSRNRQHKKQKERLLDLYKSLYTNTGHESQMLFYSITSYNYYRSIRFNSIISPPPIPPPQLS